MSYQSRKSEQVQFIEYEKLKNDEKYPDAAIIM